MCLSLSVTGPVLMLEVTVAMSGGVDSSVALKILSEMVSDPSEARIRAHIDSRST